jgi:hypothetical protein
MEIALEKLLEPTEKKEEKQEKLHLLSSNKEIFGIQKLFFLLFYGSTSSASYGIYASLKKNSIISEVAEIIIMNLLASLSIAIY